MEQEDDDDDGPGLGDAMPEIKNVAHAYRSALSEGTTLKSKSKEISNINAGEAHIEKEVSSPKEMLFMS